MHTTPTMTETRFRELLEAEGLPQPDDIERHPDELIFLWHDQKLAIAVELNDVSEAHAPGRSLRIDS